MQVFSAKRRVMVYLAFVIGLTLGLFMTGCAFEKLRFSIDKGTLKSSESPVLPVVSP